MDRIVLLDYPVRLGALQQQHSEEVIREFQLLVMSDQSTHDELPGRMLALVEQLLTHYQNDLDEPQRLREKALDEGVPRVDMPYPVRPGTREAVLAWSAMFREIDDFCRHGDLLALASPPEVVALREWMLTEFLRQLDGEDPRRWTGPV